MIDVLFITQLSNPENTETLDDYKDLRLMVHSKPATVERLHNIYSTNWSEESQGSVNMDAGSISMQVLTPIYMNEFLKRHNISMEEITPLEGNFEKASAYLREGVRIIALCTTWLTATNGAIQVRKAAKMLKSISPNTPLVVGGIGVLKALRIRKLLLEKRLTGIFPAWIEGNNFSQRLSSGILKRILSRHFLLMDGHADSDIDGIVLNDLGEITLKSIVDSIKAGKDFRNTPNLAIPEGSDYRFTDDLEMDFNLDAQIINWASYVNNLKGEAAPVRRGTGCPFKCGFCDFQGLQRLRTRSLESLIAELKTLTIVGHRKINFIDDNIAFTKKHLIDLTKAIIAEKMNISWRCFLRADTIDVETASLLKESGCKEILLGIESGDPTVLANMNKGTDPEQVLKAIHQLDSVGIRTQNTFVVGFPGECSRSIENTAAFISSIPSGKSAQAFHRYYLFKFLVSPLSPVASPELRKKFALRGIVGNWSHSTMKSKEVLGVMRELFLKIEGPSHMYPETFPDECDVTKTRNIIELRDVVQKQKLRGDTNVSLDELMEALK